MAFFRKKISTKEAESILGFAGWAHASMHMVYLIWEVPLTETHKIGRKGIYLYEDEVTRLRDSTNEKLQQVRKNFEISKKGLI
jgi:hypothetical protein